MSPVTIVEGDTLDLEFILTAFNNDGPASMVDTIGVNVILNGGSGPDTASESPLHSNLKVCSQKISFVHNFRCIWQFCLCTDYMVVLQARTF